MISVVSPPFIKSDLCRREVERFWRGAEQGGGAWVNDKARLLKVLKTAIAAEVAPYDVVGRSLQKYTNDTGGPSRISCRLGIQRRFT